MVNMGLLSWLGFGNSAQVRKAENILRLNGGPILNKLATTPVNQLNKLDEEEKQTILNIIIKFFKMARGVEINNVKQNLPPPEPPLGFRGRAAAGVAGFVSRFRGQPKNYMNYGRPSNATLARALANLQAINTVIGAGPNVNRKIKGALRLRNTARNVSKMNTTALNAELKRLNALAKQPSGNNTNKAAFMAAARTIKNLNDTHNKNLNALETMQRNLGVAKGAIPRNKLTNENKQIWENANARIGELIDNKKAKMAQSENARAAALRQARQRAAATATQTPRNILNNMIQRIKANNYPNNTTRSNMQLLQAAKGRLRKAANNAQVTTNSNEGYRNANSKLNKLLRGIGAQQGAN
jgi:hypothetical protein